MDPTYGNYNNPVPPQGQGLWDYSALDSGNPGASTENEFYEGHMPNMRNFRGVENLANFFHQPSNQFVVPGQAGSSAFEAPSAPEGETPSMRQRQIHMSSCLTDIDNDVGIIPSSGPHRSSRGTTHTGNPPSTTREQYVALPKVSKASKPRRKKTAATGIDPDMLALEAEDDLIDARAALEAWKDRYPAWHGVLQALIRTEHVLEWEDPLGAVTAADAQGMLVTAKQWYGERNPLPAVTDPSPDIFYFTQLAQNWALTADFKKMLTVLHPPPVSKPNSFRGFWPGSRLTLYHGVYNKLLAKHFAGLNTEDNVKRFLRKIINDPLNDASALLVIEVMCSLIGGTAPLNPEARPFCLRFFKNGKVEPYLMSFTLLLVHHAGRLHTSGNFTTGIDLSYGNYNQTVLIIAAAVDFFKEDESFNDFLTMVYEFAAHGNK